MQGIRVQFGVLVLLALALAALGLEAQASKPANSDSIRRATSAFRQGTAAQQAGNFAEARDRFAEAVRLAPSIPEAHEALGAVLLELNRPAEATRELETALKLKPADTGIETNLALAFAAAGQPDKAVPYFQTVYADSQQPGQSAVNEAFCEAYARALAATGNGEESIGLFRAAEQRGGDRGELEDDIGMVYGRLDELAEARNAFEQSMAANSKYAPARVHLGILLRRQGDLAGSIAALDDAVHLQPSNAMAHFESGRTLEAAGKDEEALPHLQQTVRLDAGLTGSEAELGTVLQRLGRQDEAISWFQKAIEIRAM